ncbi:hypothetical protein HDV02_002329 [Globomyces sp. JEL0801]|nr:hypothetical protein HDV02_002329 [Globomyces sp. JEL0801]
MITFNNKNSAVKRNTSAMQLSDKVVNALEKTPKMKPMGGLRKALSASLDSFKEFVGNFELKKRSNTSNAKVEQKNTQNHSLSTKSRIDFGKNIEDTATPVELDLITEANLNIPKINGGVKGFFLGSASCKLSHQESQRTMVESPPSSQSSINLKLFDASAGVKGRPLPKTPVVESTIPESSTLEIQQQVKMTREAFLAELMAGNMQLCDAFASKYDVGDLLGDGAFGFVFTATKKEDQVEVAVKFIERAKISNWVTYEKTGEHMPSEIHTLLTLNHPNIIKYIEHINESDYILLVTELHGTPWDASNLQLDPKNNPGLKFKFRPKVPKGKRRTSCDLFECIDAHTRIPIPKAKFLFTQVVLACEYLFDKKLVHRDIKDENICVNERYVVKLIDFGSSSKIPQKKDEYFKRYNGTPHFAAPEIVRGKPYQGPQAEVCGRLHYPRHIDNGE